ncbi:hypothetical protein [Leifsonia sp. NPDC077715]|uniref:hypothetical protein n=1 Tax=Leifsonia sp. NPDC077715 TaxID=3155539 RepID=UPI00344A3E33
MVTASEALTLSPAATTVVAWAVGDEVKGFRGDATPEGVALLTRLQTAWMLVHAEQLQVWAKYETFPDDVLGIWPAEREGKNPLGKG